MRFEIVKQAEHLGSISIYDVRRALELDSGSAMTNVLKDEAGVQFVSREAITDIEQRMAIVLPIRNEDLKVFEGVLSGIPHDCLMIVVSNSGGDGVDVFKNERDILSRFCNTTKRQALIVHQKDENLAKAFSAASYTDILGDDGLIRNGKSEGMVLGIIMATLAGKDFVGFIDTDNYIPGAVLEYAKHYATGFSMAKSPYSMVRILWRYKPKLVGELYFKKWGRVSEISNKFLNNLLSTKGKFEIEIIKTANSGEHAMSLELAHKLTYGSSYAIETQEIISILEQFGGIIPVVDKGITEKGVEIIQTETINPHLHAEKGGDHLVQEMLLPSLSVIYHSSLCEDSTRELIRKQLMEAECLKENEDVPKMRMLPPPQNINLQTFAESIESEMPRYTVPEKTPFRIAYPRTTKLGEVIKILVTDLDGALLHPVTYSYTMALDAIRKVQEKGIPMVFCSSKTFQEQQVYRGELGVVAPFIVENGSAIYMPKDYFRFPFSYDKVVQDYLVIELGMLYQELRHRLSTIIETTCRLIEANPRWGSINITSFGDMSNEDVAKETGLSLKLAALARQREYSETLKVEGSHKAVEALLDEIKKAGLTCTHGGRFYQVTGGSDKGKATKILLELYKINYGNIRSYGIGDSMSDESMLASVNYPILVQGMDHHWQKLNIRNLNRIKGIGPEGWNHAVEKMLADI